ncbi:transcriptional regulator TrmB [Gluconacetobacter sacchari DSM 12717]|nr:transcriptional regulator TrmB [Gluconacetobacter sacchari DSM 12717]
MTRSEPVRYTAVSHSKFIGALRQQFEADLTTAENGLAQLPASHTNGLIWSLRSTEGVVSAIRNTIEDAKYEVHAALWDKELEYVAPCLEQASARGIEVHVAVYGRRVLDGPVCYDLTLCGESSVIRLAGRRLSAVVADQAKAVIAEFRADDAVEALVTDSPLVSLLAVEYIKGDVLGRLIINEMGQDVFEHLRESSSSFRSILSARPDAQLSGQTTAKMRPT